MDRIPYTITVSRETGQVVGAERGPVKKAAFKRLCQELIACGRGESTQNESPLDSMDRVEGLKAEDP